MPYDRFGRAMARNKPGASAAADDDMINDDNYNWQRDQSYDYTQEDQQQPQEDEEYYEEGEEGEEGQQQQQQQQQYESAAVVVRVRTQQDAEAAAARRKHQEEQRQQARARREEAQQARETLVQLGYQMPESMQDDAVLAMLERLEWREQAQERDLQAVLAACPYAEVNDEERSIMLTGRLAGYRPDGDDNSDDEDNENNNNNDTVPSNNAANRIRNAVDKEKERQVAKEKQQQKQQPAAAPSSSTATPAVGATPDQVKAQQQRALDHIGASGDATTTATTNEVDDAKKGQTQQQQQTREQLQAQRRRRRELRRRYRAVISVSSDYPDQPALAFIKGLPNVEAFVNELLRNLSNQARTAHQNLLQSGQQHQDPRAGGGAANNGNNNNNENNNNNADEGIEELGGMGAAQPSISSEPVFLTDVVRFTQQILDSLLRDDEMGESAAATAAQGQAQEEADEQLQLCAREWRAMTGEHIEPRRLHSIRVVSERRLAERQARREAEEEYERQVEEEFQLRLRRRHESMAQQEQRMREQSADARSRRDAMNAERSRAAALGLYISPRKARQLAAERHRLEMLEANGPEAQQAAAVQQRQAEQQRQAAERQSGAYAINTFMARLQDCHENHWENFGFSTPLYRPIPEQICAVRTIKYLNLTGIKTNTLPREMHRLPLVRLTLRNNRFTDVPSCIGSMRNLQLLDMASNRLTAVPEFVGRLSELRVMDFAYNQIESLCSFAYLQHLESLDLIDNNLPGVPPEVGALPKLWYLNIRSNPCIEIPHEVYYARDVEVLKHYLQETSTKSLPVPPPSLAEDIAYLHMQIPDQPAELRTTVFSGVLPEASYVPLGGEATDDYSSLLGGGGGAGGGGASNFIVTIMYKEKRTEVTVDSSTGRSEIEEIVDAAPKILFKSLRWVLATRVPGLLEPEFLRAHAIGAQGALPTDAAASGGSSGFDDCGVASSASSPVLVGGGASIAGGGAASSGAAGVGASELIIELPEPMREAEARIFACFVLAPTSPFVVSNFSEAAAPTALELIDRVAKKHTRNPKTALGSGWPQEALDSGALIDNTTGAMVPLPELFVHWVPVACGEDLSAVIARRLVGQRRQDGVEVAGNADENDDEDDAGQQQQQGAAGRAGGGAASSSAAAAGTALAADRSQLTPAVRAVLEHNETLTRLARADPDVIEFLVAPAEGDHAGEVHRMRAHRSLLALRCGFFRHLFVDDASASQQAEMVIDDVEPAVFATFLHFLYSDNQGKKMSVETICELLFLAARYECPRLRAIAEQVVGYHVDVDNVCRVLQMAFFLQSSRLKDACVLYAVTNRFRVEVQPDWYELDEGLRDEISGKIRDMKAARRAEAQ